LSGNATINALLNLAGNIASQITDPCFSGNIDLSEAAAAALLGAYNLGDRGIAPNLLSNTEVAAHQVVTQSISGTGVGLAR